MKTYLMQNLIAFDQQLNTLLNGMADETLSARAHRMREKKQKYWGWTANAIDFVFSTLFREKNHCYNAYMYEIQRRQQPAVYRTYP